MIEVMTDTAAEADGLVSLLQRISNDIITDTDEDELTARISQDKEYAIEIVILYRCSERVRLCRGIRLRSQVPILVIDPCGDPADLVTCLQNGADEYLREPNDDQELIARIRALQRRSAMQYPRAPVISIGPNTVDFRNAIVMRCGKEVNLTSMEYRLLLVLIRHQNTVLTRMEILDILYNDLGEYVSDNTLTVYIKRLRSKLADDKGEYIRTVRGVGYILKEGQLS